MKHIKATTARTSFVLLGLLQISSCFLAQEHARLPPSKVHSSTTPQLFATNKDDDDQQEDNNKRRELLTDATAIGLIGASAVVSGGTAFLPSPASAGGEFKRVSPIQFIAALGDPASSAGTEAKEWGIWTVDPGPRGVMLRNYERSIVDNGSVAPAGWKFDKNDWWLEEHGLIMEAPAFPLAPGRYQVTGGRRVTTGLTVDANGGWKLDDGQLFDVTHLPCRSARYTPAGGGSPETAKQSDFPVTPGAEMPKVEGCNKQDYAVLFVVGKAA